MRDYYDVAVVGAGNAGLTAAATAARRGLDVLLLERNRMPGGCATSFVRGRFEFETALHELANIGTEENPGSVRRLFDGYGADISWVAERTAFRVITGGEDGYDVTMPAGVEEFCDAMERYVPGSRDSTEAVFALAKKADAAVKYLSSGKPDPAVLMSEHADFLRMASHSVDECLVALGMPEKARNIIKTYWCYLGAPTDSLDFAHYAMMLSRYVSGIPALPTMKSAEIALALDKVIRDAGGDILYNTPVTEILTEGGKAVGVRAGGREYRAGTVVANCFPDTAFSGTLKDAPVPARSLKLANARKKGLLFFTLYVGLNRSAEQLGIKDYSVFIFRTPDAAQQYRDCGDPDTSLIIANCLNNAVPGSSPEGTCTLFFTSLLSEDAWGSVPPDGYRAVKTRMAARTIREYEKKTGVVISPYIEELEPAAPPTFARYLGTPNGTAYGYETGGWDGITTRAMTLSKERVLDNLCFAGAHAERGDGYSSAFANGNSVGQKLRKGDAADAGA